jgi:prepilin-type processing-associated H-X9-DG protein
MLLPALSSAKAVAKASTCMNNIKQVAFGGFMMYAEDYNGYVVQTDGNTSWGAIYNDYAAPQISSNGYWNYLGYVPTKLLRCPTAQPEEIWWRPHAWYMYGIPNGDNLANEVQSVVRTQGGTNLSHLILKKMNDPSRFMGLTDSINPFNNQMQLVNFNDWGAFTDQFSGRYHLRHNNLANTWFYDGHAEKIGIDGVADIAKASGASSGTIGRRVYATGKLSTVSTIVK